MKLIRMLRYKIKKILGLYKESNIEAFLNGGGVMGSGCEIFPDVFFGSEPYLITLGNNVRLTYGVKFATHDGGLWTLRQCYPSMKDMDSFGKISIGDNTNIGWNAIILPGVYFVKCFS